MRRIFSAALPVLFLCVLSCPGKETGELDSILASVNGSPISLQDVLPLTRAEEYKAFSTRSGDALKKRIVEIRREAVDELIDRKLILEDYAGKKFEISERDIESAVDEVARRMGVRSRDEFLRALARQGTSIEEVRKNVRDVMIVQLMLHRAFAAERSVTPEMMFDYYKKHGGGKDDSGVVELAMILLHGKDEARTAEIAGALKRDPGSFSALAAKWSDGPGKEDGGRLGRIRHRLLRPEFAAAVGTPVKGKIHGPIATPEGTVFLKVLDWIPPVKRGFKESLPEIRRALEAEQRKASRKNYTQRLRKEAIIRYFF
ncbi:MAG: SurA N-terminal domain-containing protein [Lentisphaeria bacterium]|nr:SurA N-terminal domain-containing protein [Lentisphaeria bacterium]